MNEKQLRSLVRRTLHEAGTPGSSARTLKKADDRWQEARRRIALIADDAEMRGAPLTSAVPNMGHDHWQEVMQHFATNLRDALKSVEEAEELILEDLEY